MIEQLILDNMSWARGFARNRACRSPASVSLPDMEQAALLGLVQAAMRYNAKQAPFRTFATYRIKGAVEDELRGWWAGSRRRPDDELFVVDTDLVEQQAGSMPVERLGDVELAEQLLASMTDRQRRVTVMSICDGMRLKEAAAVLKITESGASQLRTAGLTRAREAVVA